MEIQFSFGQPVTSFWYQQASGRGHKFEMNSQPPGPGGWGDGERLVFYI